MITLKVSTHGRNPANSAAKRRRIRREFGASNTEPIQIVVVDRYGKERVWHTYGGERPTLPKSEQAQFDNVDEGFFNHETQA